MSFLEVEQRRLRRRRRVVQRRKKKPTQYYYTLDAPLSASYPDQILLFREWCRLNCISERTGRRILASDNGPEVTQISDWRVGITIANNAKWQAAKSRQIIPAPPPRRRGRMKARV